MVCDELSAEGVLPAYVRDTVAAWSASRQAKSDGHEL